jgi:hypothetical protein
MTDFDAFLDRRLARSTLPATADGHDYYGDFFFQHHHPSSLAKDHAYFVRAVERFRHLLASPAPKVFVCSMVNREGDIPSSVMRSACLVARVLESKTTNSMVVLLYHTRHLPGEQPVRFYTRDAPRLVVARVAIDAPSDGTRFTDPVHNELIERILRHIIEMNEPETVCTDLCDVM